MHSADVFVVFPSSVAAIAAATAAICRPVVSPAAIKGVVERFEEGRGAGGAAQQRERAEDR